MTKAVQNLGPDRDKQENNEKQPDQSAEDTTHASSFMLPLLSGKVTGLPKDLSSAPNEIHLSPKLHQCGDEALQRTQQSGNEYGFFLHFDDTGQIRPGKVRGPSEQGKTAGIPTWITQEEYLELKKHDRSIHGHLHTYPASAEYPDEALVLSVGNIALFLEAEDVVLICRGPKRDWLILLRTQITPPTRNGLGEEAVQLYLDLARDKLWTHLMAGMEQNQAYDLGFFEAMIEVCKKYNIVLYQGTPGTTPQKLT